MDEKKKARVDRAKREAAERRQKAIVSLAHCLGRSDVYRYHHEGLIHEMLDAGEEAALTNVKKLRFAAYTFAWLAGLAAVIERFDELVRRGTIPASDELSVLITPEFVDLLKPFRNAVAHCSDHDDDRVLSLLSTPHTTPDRATAIAAEFRRYFALHSTRPIYVSESGLPE